MFHCAKKIFRLSRILASTLGARYGYKVRVGFKIKAADIASKEYRVLVYFFHIIVLIYNIF